LFLTDNMGEPFEVSLWADVEQTTSKLPIPNRTEMSASLDLA
jgi:hypothetical protein